jgi:hypothetical protein
VLPLVEGFPIMAVAMDDYMCVCACVFMELMPQFQIRMLKNVSVTVRNLCMYMYVCVCIYKSQLFCNGQ